MIETLRTYSHQLADCAFNDAHELVSYMGAVQAQDIEMSKWAVGMRLQQPSLRAVKEALDSGKIIRTHILRPTWHMVAAEDIRWMIDLTGKKMFAVIISWGKSCDIDSQKYIRFRDAIGNILGGSKGLTKQEITEQLQQSGFNWDTNQVHCMLSLGETDGLLCNGKERNKKHTYALLDEWAPGTNSFSKEEALRTLALRYFRSHSPASVDDFVWWSGLNATEAKAAIYSIEKELISDRYEGQKLYVHESCAQDYKPDETVHLLPPYDEYLISYKDRTHVLPGKYTAKAHNKFGIFYPVIFFKGKIVGNWKKVTKKGNIEIETSFFVKSPAVRQRKLKMAIERYIAFINSDRVDFS
ncbi:MAG: winged helix DNA-binding domain-containing protein [Bacteroides sp.]|nr:winged helix DNA-binding domain-containing protein [Bacteroides sp.]